MKFAAGTAAVMIAGLLAGGEAALAGTIDLSTWSCAICVAPFSYDPGKGSNGAL